MVGKPLMPKRSASALLPSVVQSTLASAMGLSPPCSCLAAASHSGASFCDVRGAECERVFALI